MTERCQYKCFICLGYLKGEITKNVNAMLSSMTTEYNENEVIEESNENVADDDLSDIDNGDFDVGDLRTFQKH